MKKRSKNKFALRKDLIFALLCLGIFGLFSFPSFCQEDQLAVEGEITHVLLPNDAAIDSLHVCVSSLKGPEGTVVLVEDERSCHYALKFKNLIGHFASFKENQDLFVEDRTLQEKLTALFPANDRLKFFFLEIE